MIKISVIMPVFNAEKHLKDSIESILNQSCKEFEFIIINDGSTDSSFNIIKKYEKQDKRIIVISRKNKGLVESLNDGIKISKGEYIARMDADDISHINRFEKQLRFIEKNNIDICGTYVDIIGNDNNSEIVNWYNIDLDNVSVEEFLLKRGTLCHPSVIINRQTLKKLGLYSSKYSAAEDYDLWVRALKEKCKFGIVKSKLLYNRRTNSSKTNIDKINNQDLRDWINIKLDYLTDKVNVKNKKIYIWGASLGGSIVKDILKKRLNIDIVAFIDSYKEGEFSDKQIIKFKSVNSFNDTFIVSASRPGKVEIEKQLINSGLKEFRDYIILI